MQDTNKFIPFNYPSIVGNEKKYLDEVLNSGHLAGDGSFTRRCQEWMEREFKVNKVLLTNSCTAALELSAILADIQPGDEVIMPSYTFVSTANPFALRGAKIKWVDIREDTLNIDENLIEAAINERTRAIVPVHYAGIGAEMTRILELADQYNLVVIEDAAQGMNATYKNQYLGTIGHLAAYSFHETKNFISGEGGAILINDEKFEERAEIIREKGTNRAQFFRGEVDKYTWMDLGSSFLPSELIAAFLLGQIEKTVEITEKRMNIFNYYADSFKELEDNQLIRTLYKPDNCEHNAHMYFIIVNDSETRNKMLNYFKQNGIGAVYHYIPLHNSPMGKRLQGNGEELPVTDDLSARIIRLPLYYKLTREDQDRVIRTVKDFFR